MYFRYFVIISLWKKAWTFILTNLNLLHPRMLCAKFGWNWAQWFWRKIFLNFIYVFSLFRNYLPLERSGPFIWSNLNPLHPRMLCAKFGWNWPTGSGEEIFFFKVNCQSIFENFTSCWSIFHFLSNMNYALPKGS